MTELFNYSLHILQFTHKSFAFFIVQLIFFCVNWLYPNYIYTRRNVNRNYRFTSSKRRVVLPLYRQLLKERYVPVVLLDEMKEGTVVENNVVVWESLSK